MKFEIGDKMRILDPLSIYGGWRLTLGGIYEVTGFCHGCHFITDDDGLEFFVSEHELAFVERLSDADVYQYEMSDAELGEPSESPNVTLSEVYEELLDMKAMIGRLIRNGEES